MTAEIITLVQKHKPSNFIDGRRIAVATLHSRHKLAMRAFIAGFMSLMPDESVQDALEVCTIEATFRNNRNGKNSIQKS